MKRHSIPAGDFSLISRSLASVPPTTRRRCFLALIMARAISASAARSFEPPQKEQAAFSTNSGGVPSLAAALRQSPSLQCHRNDPASSALARSDFAARILTFRAFAITPPSISAARAVSRAAASTTPNPRSISAMGTSAIRAFLLRSRRAQFRMAGTASSVYRHAGSDRYPVHPRNEP